MRTIRPTIWIVLEALKKTSGSLIVNLRTTTAKNASNIPKKIFTFIDLFLNHLDKTFTGESLFDPILYPKIYKYSTTKIWIFLLELICTYAHTKF
jgi:hypothetical protein